VQPGSSFKPLYYSAAIDAGAKGGKLNNQIITPSTLIYDSPMVFYNEDGTPYIPQNFMGEWSGSMLLYYALATSQNVASVQVLNAIGFDAAINRAAALLGITDPATIKATFPRVYPLALGVISIAPIQMATAFATFANQGQQVTPIAIKTVEDRNGKVIIDNERDVREAQRKKGAALQIISPQNAYVMTKILEKTVSMGYGVGGTSCGTLFNPSGQGSKFKFKGPDGKIFTMPMAGKTGTPQNWSDAWTIGFSPYYTTAVWFGFDKPGNSLGVNLTGSTLAGYVWADYMREIHQGLPFKDFIKPATGTVDVKVCADSGLLATDACPRTVTLTFLSGTEPKTYCNIHHPSTTSTGTSLPSAAPATNDSILFDASPYLNDIKTPTLDLDSITNFDYSAAVKAKQAEDQASGELPLASTPTEGTEAQSAEETGSTATATSAPAEQPVTGTTGTGTNDSGFGVDIPSYTPFMN
jgi:penicillin-binding protein 1A